MRSNKNVILVVYCNHCLRSIRTCRFMKSLLVSTSSFKQSKLAVVHMSSVILTPSIIKRHMRSKIAVSSTLYESVQHYSKCLLVDQTIYYAVAISLYQHKCKSTHVCHKQFASMHCWFCLLSECVG